ncbi:hypothetical protein VNI00_003327 [Paramarasmius palmivorus]|uniref:Transcription elongation factor 1 homolog n=1 Tax=Paramarasmius palmivorus TaxID=297713 RepID=A0AAW0DU26_9AGAR
MGKRKKSSRKPAPARQKVPLDLTEPIDIYSEWIDAADEAQRAGEASSSRRPAASSGRAVATRRTPSVDSDED